MTDTCLEFQPELISGQLHLTALEICTVFIVLLFNFAEVLLFFSITICYINRFFFKCDNHYMCEVFVKSSVLLMFLTNFNLNSFRIFKTIIFLIHVQDRQKYATLVLKEILF